MNEEDFDKIATLANLETIRSARIEPLQLQTRAINLNVTEDRIKLPKLRPGRIHVITAISFLSTPSGKPQVFLSLLSKGEEFNIYSKKITVNADSITWSGQIIGLEYDEICARVTSMGATDTAILTAFGYSMRF
jgi:hypothetical protein